MARRRFRSNMAKPRRTRWYDVVGVDIAVESEAAGVANGTSQLLLSEAQIEDELQGRATLIRVVGDIYATRSLGGGGKLVMAIITLPQTEVIPNAFGRLGEDYERKGVLWTKLWSDQYLSTTLGHIPVDVSTKRVLEQNMQVWLTLNNAELTIDNDINIDYHLRLLVLLS